MPAQHESASTDDNSSVSESDTSFIGFSVALFLYSLLIYVSNVHRCWTITPFLKTRLLMRRKLSSSEQDTIKAQWDP